MPLMGLDLPFDLEFGAYSEFPSFCEKGKLALHSMRKSTFPRMRTWFEEFIFQSGNLNFLRKFTDGNFKRVLRMMEESKMILAETDFSPNIS